MKFSLIICTYMRPEPLLTLLKSVNNQVLYPDQIIIVDGSVNDETQKALAKQAFKNLSYYKVDDENRGLTKQRNYGVDKVNSSIDVISFLDDDIVLKKNYFKKIIETYKMHPNAVGVGGYIIGETKWKRSTSESLKNKYQYDGWERDEPLRFRIRSLFNLLPKTPPCYIPPFAHGRSVSFLPPSGKIYQVEQFMGGVSSYKKDVFNRIKFSHYFEGYGLYEDVDFTYRLSQLGDVFVNTNAQLYHYHEETGRPNYYKYGKMVVRNGWYVWRLKNPKPKFVHRIKWHAITLLLIGLRLLNVIQANNSKKALTDSLGRIIGWFSLIYSKPIIYRTS